ncbi:MAG: NAD(P)H-hydrate epimerase [Anaerovoracaceae bacterium]
MHTVTAAQMKQIEKNAFEQGMPYLQMMENAGSAAYRVLRQRWPEKMKLSIVVGKGNNGGDGFVMARLAALDGLQVQVILAEGEPVTQDARTNYQRLKEIQKSRMEQVKILPLEEVGTLSNTDLVVDALYGTGFHGTLRQSGEKACRLMNESSAFTISLDVPSGVHTDTGEAAPGAAKADVTIVFDSYKNLHQMDSARPLCGEIILVDIGIPGDCHRVTE